MQIIRHADLEIATKELKCPTCKGLGNCDDSEPGDISFNTWVCKDCNGTGLKNGVQYRLISVKR